MYSGGESTDSQKNTQWAMNPAAYQNTPNDQVDWAALAQQWIIMKEAGPPPIPGESRPQRPKNDVEPAEGGEAEMDMDTEKDDAPSWSGSEETPPAPGAEAWNNWNPAAGPPGPNWNWSSSWNPPTTIAPPHLTNTKTPLLPTPNRVFPDSASDNATPYTGYNAPPQSTNNQPAFWTGMAMGKITQTEIKPHNKRYSKVNVPTKVTIITPASGGEPPAIPEAAPPVLDTNKRKQLPAWIREGLEKMERDKLKQLEREKEKLANDEIAEKLKLEEKEKMEILRHTIKEKNLLKKSRFDSDNENSEDDKKSPLVRKITPPPPVALTPEELIVKMRKTMTEILLKVTNEQIEQVCKEERQRYIKKRKASDQLASAPSGALIKAKLGLGAYDEGSSSGEDSDHQERRDVSSDSENELKESIKKRQSAFSKTEQEIRERLAEVERKKRGRSRSESSSSSVDSRDKSQVEQANAPAPAKRHCPRDDESTGSSSYLDHKPRRRSSSSSRASSRKPTRRRSTRSSSSKRDRSVESYSRRGSSDSRKHSRRSRSGSRYSKRSSRRSRSRSRSPYSSRKRSRYSRRSRSRSRSYRSSRSKRSRSRSHRKRSRRSRSRSSSRGKRSHRR